MAACSRRYCSGGKDSHVSIGGQTSAVVMSVLSFSEYLLANGVWLQQQVNAYQYPRTVEYITWKLCKEYIEIRLPGVVVYSRAIIRFNVILKNGHDPAKGDNFNPVKIDVSFYERNYVRIGEWLVSGILKKNGLI